MTVDNTNWKINIKSRIFLPGIDASVSKNGFSLSVHMRVETSLPTDFYLINIEDGNNSFRMRIQNSNILSFTLGESKITNQPIEVIKDFSSQS